METISHPRARSLLQAAADKKLALSEKKLLEGHLGECQECSEYADHLRQLEANLTRTFEARWGKLEPRLSYQFIKKRSAVISGWNESVKTFVKVAVVPTLMLTFILVFFAIEQKNPGAKLALPAPSASSPALPGALLETPSPQMTQVKKNPTACHDFTYIVQKNDTVETIAVRFGISEAVLREHNQLTEGTVRVSQELSIPICESAENNSTTTPTTTSTFAPSPVLASPKPQD
jgi:LysM repeat protein